MDGIREATIDFKRSPCQDRHRTWIGNARKLLEDIRSGKCSYHALRSWPAPEDVSEAVASPCIMRFYDTEKRMEAVYREDTNKPIRKSHENPYILKLYEEFLGKPMSEKVA